MLDFGIKDVIDILLVAFLLYYVYRLMKRSGTLSLFFGVLLFIALWVIASEMLGMRLTGTILDKFMSIGVIILVIIFQDQIKRFLIDIGSRRKFSGLRRLFRHSDRDEGDHKSVMAVVYACMSMSKSKTGALIVFQRKVPLSDYEKTGDIIDAEVNTRRMSQKTDAVCVIVSEETGNISVARDGALQVKVSAIDLEHILSE